ncbi:MAG TPA: lytic transglycosylase domain-containing protein [Thermoanaerobaculia bacterium]|nr:lytic transglycosylase domain-containing protein [Thermoanaerobaculia bacterium]
MNEQKAGRVRIPRFERRGRESWRVICPCQQHGGQRAAVRWLNEGVGSVARNRGAFVLSVSLAVGGAWLPLKATTETPQLGPVPVVELIKAVAVKPVTVVAQPVISTVAPIDTALRALISERTREEFFRTEIPYGALIYKEAKKHNLSPELVAAVVKTESDFRPRLRSIKDAQGLMQIIPSTGRLMGVDDLMEPTLNVCAGAKYLRYLKRQFRNDERLVLAAYNAGEGNVRRYGGIPPFRETQNYLVRVAKANQTYQSRIARRVASAQSNSQTVSN